MPATKMTVSVDSTSPPRRCSAPVAAVQLSFGIFLFISELVSFIMTHVWWEWFAPSDYVSRYGVGLVVGAIFIASGSCGVSSFKAVTKESRQCRTIAFLTLSIVGCVLAAIVIITSGMILDEMQRIPKPIEWNNWRERPGGIAAARICSTLFAFVLLVFSITASALTCCNLCFPIRSQQMYQGQQLQQYPAIAVGQQTQQYPMTVAGPAPPEKIV